MSTCVAILKACQGAEEKLDYAFDLTDRFSIPWQANFPFPAGAKTRPTQGGTGRQHASSGGVSNGEEEPAWPLEDPGSVEDGSLTWTTEAIDFDSLRYRIADVDWTAPAAITLSDDTIIDQAAMQEARVTVAGGTRGRKYTIVGIVTTTGSPERRFEVRIELKIK